MDRPPFAAVCSWIRHRPYTHRTVPDLIITCTKASSNQNSLQSLIDDRSFQTKMHPMAGSRGEAERLEGATVAMSARSTAVTGCKCSRVILGF